MPFFERAGVKLYYEEHGSGYPLLLLAPGGMRSSIPFWERQPWNPLRELARDFRLIAMDQRNAGKSSAAVTQQDGWHSYSADQIALLDHLSIERCHVLGGCIGGSFCLGLIQAAAQRVSAAVLQQPIGLSEDNRERFYGLFDDWAQALGRDRADVVLEHMTAFRARMYGGQFVFNVRREFVAQCRTALLVLMGNDVYHPSAISREIVALAPHASLIERWREPDVVASAVAQVREFLRQHTPA